MEIAIYAECSRKLEPGGRIAVNVANLGRKPYRSLSADVIRILEHDLGLLLRGELIWQKGEGANESCAWGSFRSAFNLVLRDIAERRRREQGSLQSSPLAGAARRRGTAPREHADERRLHVVATDADGVAWYFDVAGPFTSRRGGVLRMETVWRALGRAVTVRRSLGRTVCHPHLRAPPSPGRSRQRAAGGWISDVLRRHRPQVRREAIDRLKRYAKGAMAASPLPGFWLPADLA